MPESIPGAASLPVGGSLSDPHALQILIAEQQSLAASRSLAYNEAFSRAGMFLSFLSATLIVIGFMIGTQGLSSAILPIVAILLIADLFVGSATVRRLIDASGEELHCVRGMNRIRHAFRDISPGLEPYFITGFNDDARGVLATYGGLPTSQSPARNIIHGLSTTVGMIATIDVMVFAALCTLVATGAGAGLEIGILVGVIGFLVGLAIFARVGLRAVMTRQGQADARFPTPQDRSA
jgi:hypothetical protein